MPTLEERLEVLERAQSAMKIEQIYDVRQLDERITALHRQLAQSMLASTLSMRALQV